MVIDGDFVQREDSAMALRKHRFESGSLHRGKYWGTRTPCKRPSLGSIPSCSTR